MDFRRLRLGETTDDTVPDAAATAPDAGTTVTGTAIGAQTDDSNDTRWASKLAFGIAIVTLCGFTALTIHAMVTRSHVTKLMSRKLMDNVVGQGIENAWDIGKSKGTDEVCKHSKMMLLAILGLFLAFNNCFSAAIADPSVKLEESPDESTRNLRHATVGMNAASLVMLLFYMVWYVWSPLYKRCGVMTTEVHKGTRLRRVRGKRVLSPPAAATLPVI